jgi:leucine dehydrogenase
MIFKDITETNFNGIDISSHFEFDHEKVFYFEDSKSGLKSLIAIHDSINGPAIGGCRFKDYESFDEGLTDVLRLSRGMTEKNNTAQIPFGGGKAVIFKQGNKSKTMLKSFATFLNHLNGSYISAEDIGITLEDILFIKQHSDHVLDNVDPGPYTAKGLFYAIEAAIKIKFSDNLNGKNISIQGAGSVGMKLAEHLSNSGARVFISDTDQSKLINIQNANITPVPDAFSTPCDLFAPCAVGAIFTESSIKNLNCKIIAGGANNQLLDPSIAKKLHQKGIIFIPDILINSGGVIGLTKDLLGRDDIETEQALKDIASRVIDLMKYSEEKSISILEAMSKFQL